jgi:hypothetical protein
MAAFGVRVDDGSVNARPARPDEGDELTELVLRAKSHWGYDAAFLESALHLRGAPGLEDGDSIAVSLLGSHRPLQAGS